MPAKLKVETEFVKWRIPSEDLALLRVIHGEGKVNEVAREVIAAYCRHIRAKLPGTSPSSVK